MSRLIGVLCLAVGSCLIYTLIDTFQSAHVARNHSLALGRVRAVAHALLLYSASHEGRLPPTLSDPDATERRLANLVPEPSTFVEPATRRHLTYNARLSSAPVRGIREAEEVPLVYSAAADSSGLRAVGYADGHAARALESRVQSQLSVSERSRDLVD